LSSPAECYLERDRTLAKAEAFYQRKKTGGLAGFLRELGTTLGLNNDDSVDLAERAGDSSGACVWPLSQVLSALADQASTTGDHGKVQGLVKILDRYFNKQGAYSPTTGGGDLYYDDNAWVLLGLLQLYRQTGSSKYLDRAKAVGAFLETGLTSKGELWRKGDHSPTVNTCSDGAAAQCYLQLYRATREAKYLKDAQKSLSALQNELSFPDGTQATLYRDHVDVKSGRKDEAVVSYNQGVAIGAYVDLYGDSVGDPGAQARAANMATAAVQGFLNELKRDPNWLWKQCPAFNAVLFRELARYTALVRPEPQIQAALQTYLSRAVEQGKLPNGLYGGGGMGKDPGYSNGSLIDQAGMAQMFHVLGLLESNNVAQLKNLA
jgi:uncharacterized protein YyaL (SSP411 family)